MTLNICEAKSFDQIDFNTANPGFQSYEECKFTNCNFSKADLRDIRFTDCVFHDSDFSMANITNAGIRTCQFYDCKMLGLLFHECSSLLFSLKANDCTLSHSSFLGLNLKKSAFQNCTFEEVDFTNASLEGSVFKNCKFPRATFENTNLRKLDMRTALEFDIDPTKNDIYKAIFSPLNVEGLLCKFDIQIKA